MVKSALYHRFHLAQIKRLHYVIKSSQTQRLDSALHSLHAAVHYDDGVWRIALHMRNHVKTAHAWHRDVTDYEFVVRRSQPFERFFSRACRGAVVFAIKEI